MGCQSPKLSLDLSPPWLHPSPPVADGDKKTKRTRQQRPGHDDDDDDDEEEEEEEHDPASSELRAYISRLEDELRKIEAFKRELPLTVIILNDAIERLKEEAKNGNSSQGARLKLGVDQTDNKTSLMTSAQLWSINTSSDHTTAHFLQLKPTQDNELQLQQDKNDDRAIRCQYKSKSSETQGLKPSFNHTPFFCSPPKQLRDATAAATTNTHTNTDNLLSLAGHSLCLASPPAVVGRPSASSKSSTLRGGGGRQIVSRDVLITERLGTSPSPPDQRHQNHDEHGVFQAAGRKQRRCWSPDLHRRFIDALEKLGGSQVATPKQIREIMQVEGLTNDEVKSHLQKYRLHIRRLPNATMNLSRDSSDGVRESNGTTKSSKESPSPEGPLHMPVLRQDKSNSATSRCDDNSMGFTVEEEEETEDAKGSYEKEDDERKSEGSHCLSWREGH